MMVMVMLLDRGGHYKLNMIFISCNENHVKSLIMVPANHDKLPILFVTTGKLYQFHNRRLFQVTITALETSRWNCVRCFYLA